MRLLTALLAISLLGSIITVSSAQETLARSNPEDGAQLSQAPDVVELWFSGEIDPANVQIVAIAPNGARADRGVVEIADGVSAPLRGGLGDGHYLVYWQESDPGERASSFGTLGFDVAGSGPCQPQSNATPRPPAEKCLGDPPESIPGESIALAEFNVKLELSNDQAGPIEMTVTILDASGAAVDDAVVWVRARHLEMDHGEFPYLAVPTGAGTYRAAQVGMGMEGTWRVAVDVMLPGHEPETVFFVQEMRGL